MRASVMVRAFGDSYPAVDVICHQLRSSELARGVEVGQLDLALPRRHEPPPGVDFRTVLREEVCVAVSRSGPLARLRQLSITDLASQDFILPVQEDVASVRPTLLRICREAGCSPRIVAHTTSIQVMVELVAQGVGVAFVARSWARQNPNVIVQELRDVQERMELAIAFRPEGISSQARNLLDLAVEPTMARAVIVHPRVILDSGDALLTVSCRGPSGSSCPRRDGASGRPHA